MLLCMAPIINLANHFSGTAKDKNIIPLVFGKRQGGGILQFRWQIGLKCCPSVREIAAKLC